MTGARFRYAAILLLACIWSSSCSPAGGGVGIGGSDSGGIGIGGGDSGVGIAGGGIGGTGISFGQITGFGSIILNDIRFDISEAETIADGIAVTEADLGLGDVCLVQGSIDSTTATGIATRVVCNDQVEGTVTDTSTIADGVIMVMGRTVRVDVTTPTIFAGFNALADLGVGNLVEVHGFLDATSGEIQATRIELKGSTFTPGVTEVEIKGEVSGFNGSDRFRIDGLSIQIVPGTAVEVNGGIADGKFVKVKGTLNAAADLLSATRIEDETENPLVDVEAGAEVEIEGLISDFNGLNDFKVNGVAVQADNADLEGGAAADLANGVKVEVEGRRNDAGVLLAEKVKVERTSDIRIEANVVGSPTPTSLDVGVGPVVLSVNVTPATEIRDHTDDGSGSLSLPDIADGERVKIRAFLDAVSGDLIATRVEREGVQDADDKVTLRGPVDKTASAAPIVTILGVEIDTSGFDHNDFEAGDGDLGRQAFFDTINADPAPEAEVVDDGPPDGSFDKIELKD